MKKRLKIALLLLPLLLMGCGTRGGFMAVETKFGDPNTHHAGSASTGAAGGSKSANNNTKSASNKKRTVVRRQNNNGFHHVRKGETLYSIAWSYGLDYREVASSNSIYAPYTIYPGQRIDVSSARRTTASSSAPAANKGNAATTAVAAAAPVAATQYTPQTKPEPQKEQWQWPANGRLIGRFSTNNPINKGIDIEGALGESILATSAGTVVYAGQGLRGYGNLVIIKHNDTYLSAYAHASKITVKEQQAVVVGQKIAEIGATGTDKTKLHFEIRQNGKPVDPLQLLPKK